MAMVNEEIFGICPLGRAGDFQLTMRTENLKFGGAQTNTWRRRKWIDTHLGPLTSVSDDYKVNE